MDLSLRNPLLNVRDSSRFLSLEEGLSFCGGTATSAVVPYTPPEAGAVVPYKTRLPEKEIRKRLKELYRTSRSMFNESGINSLYVAVGFLTWNEKDGDEFHRTACRIFPRAVKGRGVILTFRYRLFESHCAIGVTRYSERGERMRKRTWRMEIISGMLPFTR